MTGGIAVILGRIGANFGAGMTGGMAYLYDPLGEAATLMNMETLVSVPVAAGHYEDELKGLLTLHLEETGSRKAAEILQHWDEEKTHFIQVCPIEMLNKLDVPLEGLEEAVPAQ